MTEIEEITIEDIDISQLFTRSLIIYDDNNTFEHVIECLCKYLKMDLIQAEQCAIIIHTKGKCSVKSGSEEELIPYCSILVREGLSAKIQ